jgi:hypothetical protein
VDVGVNELVGQQVEAQSEFEEQLVLPLLHQAIWRDDQPLPDVVAEWLVMLRELAAQGRTFARVRVVSLPLSDYSRFGLWCAQFTNGANEVIRSLLAFSARIWMPS